MNGYEPVRWIWAQKWPREKDYFPRYSYSWFPSLITCRTGFKVVHFYLETNRRQSVAALFFAGLQRSLLPCGDSVTVYM
jgi:hypothetical protein